MSFLGAIDAGGTSWRCAIYQNNLTLMARISFATTTSDETLGRAVEFFNSHAVQGYAVTSIGIACFGPLGVIKGQPKYGQILQTPKTGWSGVDVAGILARAVGCKIAIDTDVTAAAWGELAWGAGQGLTNIAYVTVGTGIGAGIIAEGRAIHGAMHPEAGHMRVPRHPNDLDFVGVCPFHGDCIEGLASAPALKARWGIDPAKLSDEHPAWDIQAHYLAHLAVNLVLMTAIQRVIFGGGVSARVGLVSRVADKAKGLLGHYGTAAPLGPGFEIVGAGLGLDAGLLGALVLARNFKFGVEMSV